MNILTSLAVLTPASPIRTATAARRREERHRRFETLLLRSYAIMRARTPRR